MKLSEFVSSSAVSGIALLTSPLSVVPFDSNGIVPDFYISGSQQNCVGGAGQLWDKKDKLLTVQGAADLLSVPLSTIYYWSSRGEIPVIKIGKHSRFDRTELLQHFQNQRKPDSRVRKVGARDENIKARLRSLKIQVPNPPDRSRKG